LPRRAFAFVNLSTLLALDTYAPEARSTGAALRYATWNESQQPGAEVQWYRLFFFDRAGHIEKAHEFEGADDEAAVRIAQGWREGRRMELWQRDRRVRRWE